MKKKSLFKVMFASIGVMLGLTSCTTCVTCEYTGYGGTQEQELCKPDWANKQWWDDRVDYYEDGGWKCD